MFSNRSPAVADEAPDEAALILEVRPALGPTRQVAVLDDGFLIGSGDFCDLRVTDAGVPLAAGEVHLQRGAIWIEACDPEQPLFINERLVPRLALRPGDELRLGGTTIVVHRGALADAAAAMGSEVGDERLAAVDPGEDLSALSALELCERIEAEEAEIADFERRRLMGLEALVASIEGTLATQQLEAHDARTDELLQQLQMLSASIAQQTQQLAEQEHQLLETAGDWQASQDRLARRLEELLAQLGEQDLRASA